MPCLRRTVVVACTLFLCAVNPAAAQRGQSQYCQQAQDRWQEASYLTRLAFYQVQTDREAIQELEMAWQRQQERAITSGAIDVALLAGSILTKPITLGMGAAAVAKEGIEIALIDAAMTGIVKEGLKQYEKILMDSDVEPQDALKAMCGKGKENLDKKSAESILALYLEQRIMAKIRSGEMGPIDRLWTYGARGVDQTMRPGLLGEYCKQAARTAGLMVSLGLAVRSAWTNHGKLEDIRMAIDGVRNQLTERTQIWEQRKQDLEVAAYARDECEKLKDPGRVTEPDIFSRGNPAKSEWTLVSAVSDPDKKSERRVQGNQEEVWSLALGTYHLSFRQYDLSQDGRNTKLYFNDSESTFSFQKPPSSLRAGQKFELTISASHVDRARPGYPGDARYEGAGCAKASESGRGTTAWTIVFKCAVPDTPPAEFTIYEIGTGAGTAGALRYCQGGQCPAPKR